MTWSASSCAAWPRTRPIGFRMPRAWSELWASAGAPKTGTRIAPRNGGEARDSSWRERLEEEGDDLARDQAFGAQIHLQASMRRPSTRRIRYGISPSMWRDYPLGGAHRKGEHHERRVLSKEAHPGRGRGGLAVSRHRGGEDVRTPA